MLDIRNEWPDGKKTTFHSKDARFHFPSLTYLGTSFVHGREDFKKEMATKIATGEMTPEELVDEITLMAEEINNEINASKSFAESAQLEVQKLLEETRAIQQKLQQLPTETMDALNIEKAALAVVEEEAPPVMEKVLVTAGGGKEITVKEKVAAGGGHKETNLPNSVIENFGVYDDIFEMEGGEEEEIEWSVPTTVDSSRNEDNSSMAADKNKDPELNVVDKADTTDDDEIELVANALLAAVPSSRRKPDDIKIDATDDRERDGTSSRSTDEARDAIRQKAETFRAKIKSLEARIQDGDKEAVTSIEAGVKSVPPPLSTPPLQVIASVENTIEPKRMTPEGPIRSSPLARLLCAELNVELIDPVP